MRSARRIETSASRDRYIYVPRQPVILEKSSGFTLLDQYLKNDCLLAPNELQRLSIHKYSAVDNSWLDEFCMNAFWERVVKFYPPWLAPNLITLIGFLVNFISVFVLALYCPTATEEAPSWTYFVAALGLFIYQTLDATDGKQARRTGSASPLGEIFDHGCDSISQIFVTLNICYAMKLGEIEGAVFLVCIISTTLFYCAHWTTYCTGQLRFCSFDVTEAQLSIIAILLTTGIFGPQIWAFDIFGFEFRHLVLFLSFLVSVRQIISYVVIILSGGAGKNGSTVGGTSVLFPVCPLLASIVPFVMMYNKSSTMVFSDNITPFVCCMGAVVAKATNRVIVGHMSRSELCHWDWIYVAPILLILNQYYDVIVPEKELLCFCTLYAAISLLIYCFAITRQICCNLNIYCFKIRHE